MIVIIGGTSGIGLETAKYLKEKSYKVLVAGRSKINIENIEYKYLDLNNENLIKDFFSSIDTLDGLIYSAGITTPKKRIDDFDIDIFDNIIDINVKGLLLCLKYSYKLLKKSQGKIVVVNSLAGRTYSQFSGLEYTISKSALSGVVKHLSIDFVKDNVLINSIFPSMTKTQMLIKNTDKEFLDKVIEDIPLNRIAQPEEIAKAIEFLISDKNTYMSGCGLDLNGGQFLNG
jgi:NAD(P)-dependent dehydrogenase (short-subunit alcohol dehydrogenase family)